MLDIINVLKKNEFENWDPNDFDWNFSYMLAEDCSNYFEIWWDSEKYDWKNRSLMLAKFCSKYFDIWWDPNKFDWKSSSWSLCKYCSDYFEIWWNKEKFNWRCDLDYLIQYCYKYIDIWWCVDRIVKYLSSRNISILILKNNNIQNRYKVELKLLSK